MTENANTRVWKTNECICRACRNIQSLLNALQSCNLLLLKVTDNQYRAPWEEGVSFCKAGNREKYSFEQFSIARVNSVESTILKSKFMLSSFVWHLVTPPEFSL